MSNFIRTLHSILLCVFLIRQIYEMCSTESQKIVRFVDLILKKIPCAMSPAKILQFPVHIEISSCWKDFWDGRSKPKPYQSKFFVKHTVLFTIFASAV